MMQIWLAILLIVVALLGGVALGFFIARKYMMTYLKKNPPINEQMLKSNDDANGYETKSKEDQSNAKSNERSNGQAIKVGHA